MVNTCLSKRKLQWFCDTGRVDGWDDPRFPTIRGVMRRGIRVETLIEFMLEQGPSKNTNLMEWDKLWAINKKIIDPIAGRYTCVSKEKTARLKLTNGPKVLDIKSVPIFQQNPALGDRPLFKYEKLIIDYDDAKDCKVDEKITLMKWGNVKITSVEPAGDSFSIVGEYLEGDADFKSTRKLTWLPDDPNLLVISSSSPIEPFLEPCCLG
jgi:glutamyl-tRNA synthetase